METHLPLKPERRAELEEYARLHEQSPEEALDDLLAAQLEWQRQDYADTVKAVAEAYESVKAGRTRSAGEFLEELRVKHGFPH